MKSVIRVLLICFTVLVGTPTATAGLFRAYLSFNGNDANPCTVGAPCRLLPAALAAVNDGGEIWMVDSANYNTAPVTISKSVKILAIAGALGSLVANGGDAVIINAPLGTVTLKNLSVLNFNGGVNGVTIQKADAVHFEKLSIDGFNTDASSCINVNSPNQFRIYVNDSFLRECRNGIYVNASGGTGQINVDNTRIEHPLNGGGTNTTGVWLQGAVLASLRNSTIAGRVQPTTFNGVQFDGILGGELTIINCEIFRANTGILVTNATADTVVAVNVFGSQIHHADGITVTNSGAGSGISVKVIDSRIADTFSAGMQLVNSADNTSGFDVDIARSEIINAGTTAVDLAATNGAHLRLAMRDSTLSISPTLLHTSGTASDLRVSLIRSNLRGSTVAVDHGQGLVELDGTHVNGNINDLVNHGSGNIVSLGNNFVNNNPNTGGFTYITPAIIAGK